MNVRKITVLTVFCLLFHLLSLAQRADEDHWIELTVKENATIKGIKILGQKENTLVIIKSGENLLELTVPQFLGAASDDTEIRTITASGKSIKIYGEVTLFACEENQENILGIDIQNAPQLRALYCSDNEISSLDISKNIALEILSCRIMGLEVLDISNNRTLHTLDCCYNKLTSLDTSKNPELTKLACSYNKLTSLDLSVNTALEWLFCIKNPLASLDITKNQLLKRLDCAKTGIEKLDVSNNPALVKLFCNDNKLTSLDISNNLALNELQCNDNILTTLDLSHNIRLYKLICSYNELTSLDLSKNRELGWLHCNNNKLSSLDHSENNALFRILCFGNNLSACALDSLYHSIREIPETDLAGFLYIMNDGLSPDTDNPGRNGSNHTIATNKNWFVKDYDFGDDIENTTFDCVLSIFDVTQNTTIANIYPNPVRDRLHVEANDPVSQIEIYDLTGKLILSKTIENESSFNIELSSLDTGNYIIKLTSKNGITTQKIIKE